MNTCWPRAWGDLAADPEDFEIAAVALIDYLDSRRSDVEIGVHRFGYRNVGTAALREFYRALERDEPEPCTARVLNARAIRHRRGWGRDRLAEGMIAWLRQQGHEPVLRSIR